MKNYILGVVGSIIGALIATLPWILMYIYGEMMLSLLAILIAFGAFYGYKLFKGKIDKKLPIIVSVVSIIAISIATLLIIPFALLMEANLEASFENLKILYENSEFFSAIMRDYVISVIFTIIGISGVVISLKKQLNNGISTEKITLINKDIKENQDNH